MRRLVLLVAIGLTYSRETDQLGIKRYKRQIRSNLQGCTVTPANIDDPKTPARENAQIAISCNTDTEYDVCLIQHGHPMDIGHHNSNNNNNYNHNMNIKCTAESSKNGQACLADNRLTFQTSANQCGVRIGRSGPDDTGRWTVTATEYNDAGNAKSTTKSILIYTYNRTILDFTNDRDEEVSRGIDVWFNYDDNEEDWRSGTGQYEIVRLNCNARGGRPEPIITWLINNEDRHAFGEDITNSEANSVFTVRENPGATYDDEGYIRDKVSSLDFTVDRKFLEYIESTHGIDTNPSSGQFSFDLTCDVDQGEYGNERITNTITVRRVYFEDDLKASTIGWIVGGVLVGLLLIVLVLVTLWAKATGKFCFDDGEYHYGNPSDPKRRPRHAQ